jgi:hypothetical protein
VRLEKTLKRRCTSLAGLPSAGWVQEEMYAQEELLKEPYD